MRIEQDSRTRRYFGSTKSVGWCTIRWVDVCVMGPLLQYIAINSFGATGSNVTFPRWTIWCEARTIVLYWRCLLQPPYWPYYYRCSTSVHGRCILLDEQNRRTPRFKKASRCSWWHDPVVPEFQLPRFVFRSNVTVVIHLCLWMFKGAEQCTGYFNLEGHGGQQLL